MRDRERERVKMTLWEKKTTQESIDQEYRRYAADRFPLPSPALSHSAKGAGPVSGGRGLVACACVAM